MTSKTLHIPDIEPPIPDGWSWRRLDEVCSGIFDCPHSTPKYTSSGPYVIRSQDVRSGMIDLDDVAHVSEDTYKNRISRAEPEIGDLVYSREGTYFGVSAEVPPGVKICLGQRMVLIRPDHNKINFRYLRYWLNSKRLALYISGFRDGSVAERLNLPTIRGLPVPVSSLQEQKRISEMLHLLDDKIELNTKQNRTLYSIAQALFKHWFVDFEFPDENGRPYRSSGGAMQPSELGEIPVGWEVVRIGDAVEILGGGTPSTKETEYWQDGTVDWYSPTDLTKSGALFSVSSGKQLTQSGLENSSAKLFPAYSLMMTSRATIGVISINQNEACTNQGFITLIPNDQFSLYQLHGWLLKSMPLVHSKASGSTFKEISRGTFKDFEILRSPISHEFKKVAEPIYTKIEKNTLESETLKSLRNTLLPKLMSGELRVA